MKQCKICKVTKLATTSFFYANKKSKDGLNSYCKECDKEAARQRYKIIQADPILRKKESERTCKYVKAARERDKLKKHKDEILYNRGDQSGIGTENSGT